MNIPQFVKTKWKNASYSSQKLGRNLNLDIAVLDYVFYIWWNSGTKMLICMIFFSLIGIFAIEISDMRKFSSHPWKSQSYKLIFFFFCWMIALIFWMRDGVKCFYWLRASESLFSCAIPQWSEMNYKTKAYGSFYSYSNSECKICLLHYWTLFCSLSGVNKEA